MTRQQELTISLRDILDLIETNQLVRNPMADDQPDWLERMVKFVRILKRAHELVAPDLKEPAKVASIDGYRHEDRSFGSPGGCVSVPEPSITGHIIPVIKSLSEKLQDELEPLPMTHHDIVVAEGEIQNSNLKFAV